MRHDDEEERAHAGSCEGRPRRREDERAIGEDGRCEDRHEDQSSLSDVLLDVVQLLPSKLWVR